jgi:DNA mismatch repair protein MSH4
VGCSRHARAARKTFCTVTEAIQEHGALIAKSTGLGVKVNFAQRKGFSLSISAHEYEAAPPDAKKLFVQALKKGRAYTCTTSELCGLNARLLDAAKDSLLLSLQVVDGCVATVRERLPALVAFSEASSMLDMLVNAFGFTISSCERPYVRPQFTRADGPLAIQAGVHPVACARMHDTGKQFVANSAFLSDAASHVVISGANMSGKTTYLKMVRTPSYASVSLTHLTGARRKVAINTVLAFSGCYVAAEFASFRPIDRIFTRMGNGDVAEANASTFLVECRELSLLLNHATKSSLVIIDELVRLRVGRSCITCRRS